MNSISEENGLAEIRPEDQTIYSVGISTGGSAEIKMVLASSKRKIIATTVNSEGAKFAVAKIQEAGLEKQIAVKLEDVSDSLPYENEYFDFVYARLVLHYLSRQRLIHALNELYRVLKKNGKIFIVIRSTECPDAKAKAISYDPETALTTFISEKGFKLERFFHTPETIQQFLISAGFEISKLKQYRELLCIDFERKIKSSEPDDLIEVVAKKA